MEKYRILGNMKPEYLGFNEELKGLLNNLHKSFLARFVKESTEIPTI